MRLVIWAFIGSLLAAGSVEAGHFDFDTTDVNCSILIREVYLTAGTWEENDEIAVLTPDGTCAGAATVRSFQMGLAAWGDDALTEQVVDGFNDGDTIRFVRWDASEEREIPLNKVWLISGEVIWRPNGLIILELADNEPEFDIHPTVHRHRFECPAAEFFFGDAVTEIRAGDQAAIRNQAGDIAGLMIWVTEDSAVGWAYEDDEETEELVEGLNPDEAFYFSYWSSVLDRSIDSVNCEILIGESVFTRNGRTVARLWNEPSSIQNELTIPAVFSLGKAYPNPFNASTVITIGLPQEAEVRISLFTLDGRLARPQYAMRLSAGRHAVHLDLGQTPAGQYICRVESPAGTGGFPLTLVK